MCVILGLYCQLSTTSGTTYCIFGTYIRKVWRSEAVNQKTYNTVAKWKNDKRKNYDLPKTTQQTKDWSTRTPQISVGEVRCSRMVNSSCFTSHTRHVNLVTIIWMHFQVVIVLFCLLIITRWVRKQQPPNKICVITLILIPCQISLIPGLVVNTLYGL